MEKNRLKISGLKRKDRDQKEKLESVCNISLVSHHFDAETGEVIWSQRTSDVCRTKSEK